MACPMQGVSNRIVQVAFQLNFMFTFRNNAYFFTKNKQRMLYFIYEKCNHILFRQNKNEFFNLKEKNEENNFQFIQDGLRIETPCCQFSTQNACTKYSILNQLS